MSNLKYKTFKKVEFHNFSLFKLEEVVKGHIYNLNTDFEFKDPDSTRQCFEYIETFDTLEEAKEAQKVIKQKSIIIPSY